MFQERRAYRVTERFRRLGIIAWAFIGILILAGVGAWAMFQIREVFPPLVLALVTIYLLNPIVSRLERTGVPRLAGSCLTYTAFLSVVSVALLLLVPVLIHQAQDLAENFPRTVERIADFADRVTRALEDRFPDFNLSEWISSRLGAVGENLGSVGRFLLGAAQTLALLLIGPIIAFYLLVDLPRLQRSAILLIPPSRRSEAVELASSVGRTMGGFFRGQLIVALIVGVLSSIALLIVGLPYWLVVGMITGLFNIIPLIGPFIGAIPGLVIAGALRPPITMLWVALALTAVQQIDNHFISPNVMRFTVRLHPVTVMVSLIAGATLAGFWGMLLAVPAVASVKLVVAHFWRTRVPWGHEVFHEAPPPAAVPPGSVPPPEAEAGASEEAAGAEEAPSSAGPEVV